MNLIQTRNENKREKSFKNFLSFIIEREDTEDIIFQNYLIEHWIINEKREKSFRTFWDKCGSSMRRVTFKDSVIYGLQTLRKMLYEWTPNLQELIIEDCLFYEIVNENLPHGCEPIEEDFDDDSISFDYYDHVIVEQLKNAEIRKDLPINGNLKIFSYTQLGYEEIPLAWAEIFSVFPNIKVIIGNLRV